MHQSELKFVVENQMDRKKELESLRNLYPSLSDLDLHYFLMKYYGMNDELSKEGRPSWNLLDSENLYHITFTTNEQNSPYAIRGENLLYMNGNLPFRADFVERIPVRTRRYYYFRSSNYLTPSLYDELILNLNFQQQCFSCDFCQNLICSSQANISEEEGFNLIMARGDISTLANVAEIAIVTGSFGSGEKVLRHIQKVIELAVKYGFKGRIFYMGFELVEPKVLKSLISKIETFGLRGLRMAYTVEMFSNRDRLMHGNKPDQSLNDIAETLKRLSEVGITHLQYSYIPGLDNLDDFKFGAEKLAPFAEPHISIYRPWRAGQREQHISPDYAQKGLQYLCEMRLSYERLYNKELHGNNLGNLFPFPLSSISKRWVEHRIVGERPDLRYWSGMNRPAGWRVLY